MIKRFLLFLFFISSFITKAQEAEPEMADMFRQEGKIYVVIAVMVTIFVAVVVYLAMIDRKVKKLEEELKNKK
jgi:CcmD family protein